MESIVCQEFGQWEHHENWGTRKGPGEEAALINAVQERNGRTRGGRSGLGTDMDRDVSLTLWMRGTGPVGKASGRREVGTGWCLGLCLAIRVSSRQMWWMEPFAPCSELCHNPHFAPGEWLDGILLRPTSSKV